MHCAQKVPLSHKATPPPTPTTTNERQPLCVGAQLWRSVPDTSNIIPVEVLILLFDLQALHSADPPAVVSPSVSLGTHARNDLATSTTVVLPPSTKMRSMLLTTEFVIGRAVKQLGRTSTVPLCLFNSRTRHNNSRGLLLELVVRGMDQMRHQLGVLLLCGNGQVQHGSAQHMKPWRPCVACGASTPTPLLQDQGSKHNARTSPRHHTTTNNSNEAKEANRRGSNDHDPQSKHSRWHTECLGEMSTTAAPATAPSGLVVRCIVVCGCCDAMLATAVTW